MTIADYYPWLKALHVAAAMSFVGGALAVSLFLRMASVEASVMAVHLRRWDQAVTTPAMLLVWALGLTLAMSGHWFADGWLQLKLLFVLLLSAVHGVQSGHLRRLASGTARAPLTWAPSVIIGCVLVIAILAVAKPF